MQLNPKVVIASTIGIAAVGAMLVSRPASKALALTPADRECLAAACSADGGAVWCPSLFARVTCGRDGGLVRQPIILPKVVDAGPALTCTLDGGNPAQCNIHWPSGCLPDCNDYCPHASPQDGGVQFKRIKYNLPPDADTLTATSDLAGDKDVVLCSCWK